MTDAPVEIRNQDGSIDEIVIRSGNVHIERMSNSGWFMGVEASDGSYWQFWFGAKDGRHRVEFRHTEMMPSVPKPQVVGKVTGQIRDGDQVPGMPHAICHACGLGYKCMDPDCPNEIPNPMFSVTE
jgi:hypothetical protein